MNDLVVYFPLHVEGLPSTVCFWCPGCKSAHCVPFINAPNDAPGLWAYDGNPHQPTISPSLRIIGAKNVTECHVVVTKGVLNYCADCIHEFAGKQIPMEPYADHYL